MRRRSVLKGLLAVPLVLRFGQTLAATEPIPEPPGPTGSYRAMPVDAIPEGWEKLYGDPMMDASIYRYKGRKIVSVANTVIFQGALYSLLKAKERTL